MDATAKCPWYRLHWGTLLTMFFVGVEWVNVDTIQSLNGSAACIAPFIAVERWQRATARSQFTVRFLFRVTFVVAALAMLFKWAPVPIVLFSLVCAIHLSVCATWSALRLLRRPIPAKVEADGSPAK